MGAQITQGMRQKQNSDWQHEKADRALKQKRDMLPVPFEWHIKQTDLAVQFKSFGWVPKDAIRWMTNDGKVVGWPSGRSGDQLLIDRSFVERAL